jgi:hypothetical protein
MFIGTDDLFGIEIQRLKLSLTSVANFLCRNSSPYLKGRNGLIHYCARGYNGTISNIYTFEYGHITANPNIIADGYFIRRRRLGSD